MTAQRKRGFYEKYIKRIFDIVLSGLALIILSPVIAIVALLVRVKLGSPVIFKQDRPGLNEKIFKMYKFRSMTDDRDVNGELLPDEDRLPSFGKKLRSTSLDELPELVNIFKGDMSIVGPRPLSVVYLPYYTEEERIRHTVRPGLTGLAQINGRNAISWEEKFRYDIEYVKNISLGLDISVFFGTIGKVLKREGIGQAEEAPVSLHIERKDKI
ncbi:MAG: sugar transferase [Anaerovoracaceae bacterium]|uniref:Sugar transferase n=1 Tax=Candidatus Fimisoma avicola TaxID=2840826 RepID=A0A9D1I506_9FIRM|nr:sugar transferase [Candidatus Fimisoma avicola]